MLEPKVNLPLRQITTPLERGLYLVATPIGNLRDITLRALDILHGASLIACEDTRTSGVLCKHYGIHTSLISYHEHNAAAREEELLNRIRAGEAVALVSDAGTPLISDPGSRLVKACVENGLPVFPIPGASSVLAALCKSGLGDGAFTFCGFLPTKTGELKHRLETWAKTPSTLIFFEAARRLPESLPVLLAELGNRQATICRELTKLFEEARHGTLAELTEYYASAGAPKGEVVMVIGPPEETPPTHNAQEIEALLTRLLQTHSLKDAVATAAEISGLPRKELYSKALALKV